MNTSLAVADQNHFTLPVGALFHPKTLTIGASTSRAEYQRLGAGLQKIDDAGEIWSCDFCLFGIRNWGEKEGLELAHGATGFTKGTCKKLAYIAERFTPEHRPDGFTRAHFRALLPFPQDWLNEWLPTVEKLRLSSKGVRALAVEAFGGDPSIRPVKTLTSVRIPSALFARLQQLNTTHPAALVESIVTSWLDSSPELQASALAAAAEIRRERKNERSRVYRKKVKKEKPAPKPKEEIKEPADVRWQLERFRKAQIKAGVEPIPSKSQPARKASNRLRVMWSACRTAIGQGCPAKFASEESARKAEEKNAEDCGYHEDVVFCKVCDAWHVAHRYTSEPAPVSQSPATLV